MGNNGLLGEIRDLEQQYNIKKGEIKGISDKIGEILESRDDPKSQELLEKQRDRLNEVLNEFKESANTLADIRKQLTDQIEKTISLDDGLSEFIKNPNTIVEQSLNAISIDGQSKNGLNITKELREVYNTIPICYLSDELPQGKIDALNRGGITTIGNLLEKYENDKNDKKDALLDISGIGPRTINDIKEIFKNHELIN